MSFWDDLVNTLTGNKPQQTVSRKTTTPTRNTEVATARPSPLLSRGGGGVGGGPRSFSVPAQQAQQPAPTGWFEDAGREVGNFFAGIGQNVEKNGLLPGYSDNDVIPVSGRGVVNSPFVDPVAGIYDKAERDMAAQQEQDAVDAWSTSLGGDRPLSVKRFTPEEWAGFSPEDQQALTANYALYEARMADSALGPEEGADDLAYQERVQSLFGNDRGSDEYAPNTIRVLEELGYTSDVADLDNFLNGSTNLSYEEFTGQTTDDGTAGRRELFTQLAAAPVFDEQSLVDVLSTGASLLDGIKQTGVLSPTTLSQTQIATYAKDQIPAEKLEMLDGLLGDMANYGTWQIIQQDQDANDQMLANIATITEGIDPTLVAQYFTEMYPGGDADHMTWEEFKANWIE